MTDLMNQCLELVRDYIRIPVEEWDDTMEYEYTDAISTMYRLCKEMEEGGHDTREDILDYIGLCEELANEISE